MADFKECAGKSSSVCKDLTQECEKASYNGTCPDCEEGSIVYNIPKKPKYEPVPPSGANYVQDPNYVHTDNNFTDEYKEKIDEMVDNAQSDWLETDPENPSYIKNKPENLVQDANYHHTDNNYTDKDKDKLASIEAGAQVNVQSDWNQEDNTADDYIKNKPKVEPAEKDSDTVSLVTAGEKYEWSNKTADFNKIIDFTNQDNMTIGPFDKLRPSVTVVDSGRNTVDCEVIYFIDGRINIKLIGSTSGHIYLN